MNSSEFSVKGKIYIGFDVSQKTIKVFAVCGNQACQKAETIRNSRQSIADFLKTCFPEAFRTCVVMETGTHALWMSRLVEAMGYETIVAHARDLQLIYATEKKNDAIDAERLAKLAQYDRKLLHPVRLMDEARQRDFAVMKARDTLVRQRTTIVNTVRGLLRSFGEDDAELTVRNMKDAAKTMPPDMLDIVKPLLDQLKTIDEGIKKYDRKIERLCRKYKPTDTLRQVKGVGPAIALAFVLADCRAGRVRDLAPRPLDPEKLDRRHLRPSRRENEKEHRRRPVPLFVYRTRRLLRGRSAIVAVALGLEALDDLADRRELLGVLLGNRRAELLLKCHDQLYAVKRVSAEIVDERRLCGHLLGVDAQLLDNDVFYAIFKLSCHSLELLVLLMLVLY